MHLRERAVI
jgi:hypothetical protein